LSNANYWSLAARKWPSADGRKTLRGRREPTHAKRLAQHPLLVEEPC
jgi:hypothetical protein